MRQYFFVKIVPLHFKIFSIHMLLYRNVNQEIFSIHTAKKFQRSINKTCCSSEDKFISEDTMAKVLQFIQKLCLQVLFTGGRGSAKGK